MTLQCWKCGSENLMQTPTYLEPLILANDDKVTFTVCGDCFHVNEFVNENPVRIILIPIVKGK